jgi:hypothetical protein
MEDNLVRIFSSPDPRLVISIWNPQSIVADGISLFGKSLKDNFDKNEVVVLSPLEKEKTELSGGQKTFLGDSRFEIIYDIKMVGDVIGRPSLPILKDYLEGHSISRIVSEYDEKLTYFLGSKGCTVYKNKSAESASSEKTEKQIIFGEKTGLMKILERLQTEDVKSHGQMEEKIIKRLNDIVENQDNRVIVPVTTADLRQKLSVITEAISNGFVSAKDICVISYKELPADSHEANLMTELKKQGVRFDFILTQEDMKSIIEFTKKNRDSLIYDGLANEFVDQYVDTEVSPDKLVEHILHNLRYSGPKKMNTSPMDERISDDSVIEGFFQAIESGSSPLKTDKLKKFKNLKSNSITTDYITWGLEDESIASGEYGPYKEIKEYMDKNFSKLKNVVVICPEFLNLDNVTIKMRALRKIGFEGPIILASKFVSDNENHGNNHLGYKNVFGLKTPVIGGTDKNDPLHEWEDFEKRAQEIKKEIEKQK